MKTIYFILVFFLLSTFLTATIINIPAEQPTIQAGIDASVDGDTVLVQPDTYYEHIDYNGKNITVASLYLTTQDTAYISATIIDGNNTFPSVVTFSNGEDQSALLTGFTLVRGKGFGVGHGYVSWSYGGGIYCINNSSPSLANVTITDNSARSGGGIYCEDNSSPNLQNVTITGNSAETNYGENGYGGGIYCYNSDPSLNDVTISDNTAYHGGGIYCFESNPDLQNVTITGNNADDSGGGIYCSDNSILIFDPLERCNIFLNFAGLANELYASDCPTIDVIVDTFTVLQPDDYFAYPIDNFTFDILNAKMEQVDQDLYVSPDGSNNNTGLTINEPLLTISYALTKILPDSTNPHTIHLSNGTYSPSGTGEIFPLNCRSFVSLLGEDEDSTILDGEELSNILYCYGDNDFSIENMAIQNGSNSGIYFMNNSSPNLQNVTISDNSAYYGGGISCRDNSSPSLANVTITDNSARSGGGIYCLESNPDLQNVTITGNTASGYYDGNGGGIYCLNSSPNLENVTIISNTADWSGGGIYCYNNSNPGLENVTIIGNSAYDSGGGVSCYDSSPNFNPVNRCNIFLNYANSSGCDLYASNTIDVIVDTFTVLQPDDYFTYPIDNFTFDILNAKIEQVDQDLYVSPDGSNTNTGLTINDPLLTISCALTKILPDSTNPLTIHLSNGIYSPSGTGEMFPLYCRSYVSLLGEDELYTILDGEGLSCILFCENDNDLSIENMTIQNGSNSGIRCYNSDPILSNVTITGNTASGYYDGDGGGIYCEDSSPSLVNVTILDNSASGGGGIYCKDSSPSLVNVTIIDNNATGCYGGGIYCKDSSPSLVNVIITDNSASSNGGGIYFDSSSPSLENVTISGNTTEGNGGGIWCGYNSSPSLVNVTMSDNFSYRGGGGIYYHNSSMNLVNVTISGNSASVNGGGIYCI